MNILRDATAKLADLLLASKNTVVLTGAGISTESGIPDFRSPGGLWTKIDPMYAFAAETFIERPEVFYREGLPHLGTITSAQPNRAHEVLADLEKAGLLSAIITQNVDSLHQRAGSNRVLEVHGHLRTATCMQCGGSIGWNGLVDKVLANQIPPRCSDSDCQGVYKPDCVFFGDSMTADFNEAVQISTASQLFLVIGSSLEVSPVNLLPMQASKLVIINLGPTMADNRAMLTINSRAGEALDQLWNQLVKQGAV